jgi:hypothetical protein
MSPLAADFTLAGVGQKGYPRKAGHSVASIAYREGLMALTRPWQVIDR